MKKSFVLYDDSLDILDELSNEEAGKLFKAIREHHINLKTETTQSLKSVAFGSDRLLSLVFKPFETQLNRDYASYVKKCEVNKENGKKGGRTSIKEPKQPSRSQTPHYSDTIVIVIRYLNRRAKTSLKHSTQKTISTINARLKDNFTLEDFKKVIDIKSSQWFNTDMAKFLRPETLFGTKFESYLNENISISNNPSHFDTNGKPIKGNFQ